MITITDNGDYITFTIDGIGYDKPKNAMTCRVVDTNQNALAIYEYGNLWITIYNTPVEVVSPANVSAENLRSQLTFFFDTAINYIHVATPNVTAGVTVNEVVLYTFTIPANRIKSKMSLYVSSWFTFGSSANNKFARIYFNGTKFSERNVAVAGITSGNTEGFIINKTKTTQFAQQQTLTPTFNQSTNVSFQNLTEDTNSDITIQIRAQKGVSTDTIRLEAVFARLFNSTDL